MTTNCDGLRTPCDYLDQLPGMHSNNKGGLLVSDLRMPISR